MVFLPVMVMFKSSAVSPETFIRKHCVSLHAILAIRHLKSVNVRCRGIKSRLSRSLADVGLRSIDEKRMSVSRADFLQGRR